MKDFAQDVVGRRAFTPWDGRSLLIIYWGSKMLFEIDLLGQGVYLGKNG
jgi:hypothetical protein